VYLERNKRKDGAMKKLAILTCLLLTTSSMQVRGQSGVDRDLLAEIFKIKAIDNHAHPLKYVAAGEKADDEFDALPLDVIEVFPLPVRLSPTNPEFIRAWHDLFGYSHKDRTDAHVAELMKGTGKILR